MLARKVGNLHDEKSVSVPLWRSAAVQAVQQGAVYVLIPIGMIAAIAIASNLITSWTYQQSGELMELKLQAQQLQSENEQLRVQISKLETPERIYTTATKGLGMVAPSRILYGNQSDQAAKGNRR
ncbi:cell division protein FtsL [uncultured Megasphaera sp.]|uniref:cell division protein FtsL n=1 Tax=uncultured Megasphaera sp. TaxID=165188 RepID=UPI0025FDF075|nr:cell division protein FtsL [uncultured Megasphaera sp.]